MKRLILSAIVMGFVVSTFSQDTIIFATGLKLVETILQEKKKTVKFLYNGKLKKFYKKNLYQIKYKDGRTYLNPFATKPIVLPSKKIDLEQDCFIVKDTRLIKNIVGYQHNVIIVGDKFKIKDDLNISSSFINYFAQELSGNKFCSQTKGKFLFKVSVLKWDWHGGTLLTSGRMDYIVKIDFYKRDDDEEIFLKTFTETRRNVVGGYVQAFLDMEKTIISRAIEYINTNQ
ncbi:MAG: hypothetical protein GXO89_06500 [Chlorobi bacterium]|nr:hypothetical protein [Chlorobiota bacterium]